MPETEFDAIDRQVKTRALLYLINKIVGRRELHSDDVIRVNRLLYLAWLEYASICPNFKFPKYSPMNKMEFLKYERGPAEVLYDQHNKAFYKHIKRGNIPAFHESCFCPPEYHTINLACENTRRFYGAASTEKLSNFIMTNLPMVKNANFLEVMKFDRTSFNRELMAFMKNRNIFYTK